MSKINNLLLPYRGMPKEIYIIFLARIINALGCFVMPLLTIIMTQSIGLSPETSGFYISLTGLLFIPATIVGGKLADLIGRKKVIAGFNGLGIVLYLIAGSLEPTVHMVYVIMAAAAAISAAGPAHDALLADLTVPENRSGAYSLSYMGWNMGFAVGPVMGGLLYKDHLPWVFYGDALTALLALILIITTIKEPRTGERIKQSRKLEQYEEGSVFRVLLKRRILLYFAAIMFGYNFAYSQVSFMLPMQTIQNFGEDGAKYFGYIAGFNGLVVLLFTPIVTRVAQRIPIIRRMVYGGLLYALGLGMLGVLNYLVFIFIWAWVFTLGEIILAISVTPFIINQTPASHRGRISAVIPMMFHLGNTLGPLGMGKVLTVLSLDNGWRLLGVSTLMFSMLMWRLERREQRSENRQLTGSQQI
ncbi:MAG TPA: MFS transporter [Desulfobacteria bacterium]|nr:MFS transporter [Desulfobacteria bacterium]